MHGFAGYNKIEKTIVISDPFKFFNVLKHTSVDELYKEVSELMMHDNNMDFYEDILLFAQTGSTHYDELIHKETSISHYMTDLDNSLNALVKGGYISCNHRTRFNESKHILDMKIVELTLLDKGLETLENLEKQKNIDVNGLMEMALEACKLYVDVSDIMSQNKDGLIKTFDAICLEITKVELFHFKGNIRKNGYFNFYEGYFYVYDFNRFKTFIDRNNNFELEKIIKDLLCESLIAVTELKVILTTLKLNATNELENFMNDGQLRKRLDYLVNAEYIKIDYTAEDIPHNGKPTIEIHDYEITANGHLYHNSDNLFRIKNYHGLPTELTKLLKQASNEKDYKTFITKTWLLERFIVFDEDKNPVK